MAAADDVPAPDPTTILTSADFTTFLRQTHAWAGARGMRPLADAVTALRHGKAAAGEEVKKASRSTINNLLRQADRNSVDYDLLFDLLEVFGVPRPVRRAWHAAFTRVFGRAVADTSVERFPADLAEFVGRRDTVVALTEPGTSGRVTVIEGMAGVGKSALAIHVAHRLVARGEFGDLQLYVNLRGFDDQNRAPADPYEVLEQLLLRLRGPGQVPGSLENRARAFRTLVEPRNTLIVLDDAASAEQVQPLIPQSLTVRTLVTSRTRLSGLAGAERLELRLFDDGEAVSLLRLIGGRAESAHDDFETLYEIARRCGHLPQGLAVVGAHIRSHPDWTLQDHVDALGDLVIDSPVSSALRVSYDGLPDEERQLLRLLSLSPCRDATAPASAALAGTADVHAAKLLEVLHGLKLLRERMQGRFELHALVANYVRHRARTEEPKTRQRSAWARLFDFYLDCTRDAGVMAYPFEADAPVDTDTFESVGSATQWLHSELANVVAVAEFAVADGSCGHVGALAAGLRRYLEVTGRHTVGERLQHLAVSAAGDDLLQRAQTLNALAVVYFRQARFRLAQPVFEEALAAFTEVGGQTRSIGAVLSNLGNVHQRLGDSSKGLECYELALTLRHEAGDRVGEGHTLTNIGFLYLQNRRPDKALPYLQRGAAIFRECDDHFDLCIALGNIGACYRDQGDLDAAHAALAEALQISTKNDDPVGEADTLRDIGILYRMRGQLKEAVSAHQKAVAASREIEDGLLQVESLLELGETLRATGEDHGALEHLLECPFTGERVMGVRL